MELYSVHAFIVRPTRLKRSQPDIAIADRLTFITMGLEPDRRCAMCFVIRLTNILSGAPEGNIILHHNSIKENSDAARTYQCGILKSRSGPDHIIDIPITRRTRWICQRDVLFVYAACLSIYVGCIGIRVEHL